MTITPKVRRSLQDLGYIYHEQSNETVIFDCDPLSNNIFNMKKKMTYQREDIRNNLVTSGSMFIDNYLSNQTPCDSIIQYHILRNNSLVIYENNITQSLYEQIPSVTYTLGSTCSENNGESQFLNIFYMNILKENVFLIFGTKFWLNIITFKNFGESTLLKPLMNCNSLNFKGDRIFFHAGKKIANIPSNQTEPIFTNDLIIDVKKMENQDDTYKMIVCSNHSKIIFYHIMMDKSNDLVLVELPYVYRYQGFSSRGLLSFMSLLSKKSYPKCITQLNDDQVLVLFTDNNLILSDFSMGERHELFKEVLNKTSNNFDSQDNNMTSTNNYDDSCNSFIKLFKIDNIMLVVVYHHSHFYIYNYKITYFNLISVFPCPLSISDLTDYVVMPFIDVISDSSVECAFLMVGTTETDEVSYNCLYFWLHNKSSSFKIEFIDLTNGNMLTDCTPLSSGMSDDVNTLASVFSSVDDVHCYFLHRIFFNTSILYESIVDALKEYEKSCVLSSSLFSSTPITIKSVKSLLVEIVENEIDAHFSSEKNKGSSSVIKVSTSNSYLAGSSNLTVVAENNPTFKDTILNDTNSCSPTVVAIKIWQRIYMTILASNSKISSQIFTIPSRLYFYPKFGNYIINTYNLDGLKLFCVDENYELLKKNSKKRNNSNVIVNCSKIFDIPDVLVAFRNFHFINNNISKAINDNELILKNCLGQCDKYANQFKNVCMFFSQLSKNYQLKSLIVDIEKEYTADIILLFKLFVDNCTLSVGLDFFKKGCTTTPTNCADIDDAFYNVVNDSATYKNKLNTCESLLSKMLSAHLSYSCLNRFLTCCQMLMSYYSLFESELYADNGIDCGDNDSQQINVKNLLFTLHILFVFYGQCFKLCCSDLCTRSNSSGVNCVDNSCIDSNSPQKNDQSVAISTNPDYIFNMKNLNDVLDVVCYDSSQLVVSNPSINIVCASYTAYILNKFTKQEHMHTYSLDMPAINHIYKYFYTPCVAECLFNCNRYHQVLFHCYTMIILYYQIYESDSIKDKNDSMTVKTKGYLYQLQYFIARSYIKLQDFKKGKLFYNEILLSLIDIMSEGQLSTDLSICDQNMFESFINTMIADFIETKNPHPNLLLELIDIGLCAPIFKHFSVLESTQIEHTHDDNNLNNSFDIITNDTTNVVKVNFNDNILYNNLLYAKFMCYIYMADFNGALELLSLFYCDISKKLQRIAIVCNAVMDSDGKASLNDINFKEYLPLVIKVLKELIIGITSHTSIITYSKQACDFCISKEYYDLAAFFCVNAYYKLYDGCLLKYWPPDRDIVHGLAYFIHTLKDLIVGSSSTTLIKLPLFVSHDEQTIKILMSEYHINPKTIITLDDINEMCIFADTCVAIEHKLKSLQFLSSAFPVILPFDMVKCLIKYNMFETAIEYTYNKDQDLLQYALNAITLQVISSNLATNNASVDDSSENILLLQKYCYKIVDDSKQTQLLCNLIRIYLSKQINPPEWLESLIAQTNVGLLVQTYLLELRLDKAAHWCIVMLDNILNNLTNFDTHTVNSCYQLVELTFSRLDHLVKSITDPNDAIAVNVILNRLSDSIKTYNKHISYSNV